MIGYDVKDERLVGDENSEKRLVDGNMNLAYKMNCTQMNLDKPWEIFL